jgi:hypothetical protein
VLHEEVLGSIATLGQAAVQSSFFHRVVAFLTTAGRLVTLGAFRRGGHQCQRRGSHRPRKSRRAGAGRSLSELAYRQGRIVVIARGNTGHCRRLDMVGVQTAEMIFGPEARRAAMFSKMV